MCSVVRAITFDMDGTLVDIDAAVRAGLDASTEAREASASTEAGEPAPDQTWASMPTGPWPIIDAPAPPPTHPLTSPFADVLATLRLLRKSYLVGVGSNGNIYPERCGLAGEFDFQLYADAAGVPPKPAATFFAQVVRLAGVAAEEIVFVGDSLTDDIVAAQSFGMWAVWLNRCDRVLPRAVRPDAVITALDQLPAAIALLGVGRRAAVAGQGHVY